MTRAFLLVAIHAGRLCLPSVPRPAESQVPVSFLGLQGAWGAAGVCRPEKHGDTLGVVRLEHQHVTVPRDTFSPRQFVFRVGNKVFRTSLVIVMVAPWNLPLLLCTGEGLLAAVQ